MPFHELPTPPAPYDVPALHVLEGQARAATHFLARRLGPVQRRLATELDAFDLLTATPEECARRRELEGLLLALQGYCESADAYTNQLRSNLAATEEALHREAVRGNFAMRQAQLLVQDNQRLGNDMEQQTATFQAILLRRAA